MRYFLRLLALATFAGLAPLAYGQPSPPAGDMQDMKSAPHQNKTNPSANQAMPGMNMQGMAGMGMMEMPSSTDLLSPMSQEGSGTSWLPASTPTYSKMWMFRRDML